VLGEPLQATTLVFAVAVVAVVFAGKRMSVSQPMKTAIKQEQRA
jgi:hypothetical protein